jgi:hypothetical protein
MATITQRDIDQLHSDHHRIHGGTKEDYFGTLYLMKTFDLDLETALAQTTFGGRDYGVDGFHFDRSTGNLYLFQFKWSDDHNLFRDSLRRMTDDGMGRIFDRKLNHDPHKNPVLVNLDSLLHEKGPAIRSVFIHFIFKGNPDAAEKSLILDKLREDLEAKKYLVDEFLEKEVGMVVEFRSIAGKVAAHHKADKTHRYDFHFDQAGEINGPSGERMVTGYTRLNDLRLMYYGMRQRLFDRNIRSALSDDEAPNRSLSKTFADIVMTQKVDPAVFPFHHNGVTIYAEQLAGDGTTRQIVEPRVLNGAQTVSSFDAFCAKNKDDPRFQRNAHLLESIMVPCRIILDADNAFVTQVTINNNRQNPVMPWALRANDDIQLRMADKFRDDLGMPYERQEGAFKNFTLEELEQLGISSNQSKAVEMKKLAATFLACDGEVDKISRLKEVFESEKIYHQEAFPQKRLDADFRRVIIAYKVERLLKTAVKEIIECGEKRYLFVRKGRNMVWSLLIQGMLNDSALRDRLEAGAGQNLVMDAGFKEWVLKIATSKVRYLLSDLTTVDRYKKQMGEERFEFLRTKAAFESAMEFAHKRYNWVMKRV